MLCYVFQPLNVCLLFLFDRVFLKHIFEKLWKTIPIFWLRFSIIEKCIFIFNVHWNYLINWNDIDYLFERPQWYQQPCQLQPSPCYFFRQCQTHSQENEQWLLTGRASYHHIPRWVVYQEESLKIFISYPFLIILLLYYLKALTSVQKLQACFKTFEHIFSLSSHFSNDFHLLRTT